MKRPTRMVVVPERPARRWTVAVAALVIAVIAGVAGYVFGQRGYDGIDPARFEAAVAALDEKSLESERLTRELADAELSKTVDSGANEKLRETIKGLNDDVAALQEEVRFYKRLMAPSEAERGLRIEQLSLESTAEDGRLSYSLLLTQIVDRHSWIQGDVSMDVIGEQAGVRQVLPLTDLSEEEIYPLKFRFRYFQDFTGALTLPAGFEPREVHVTARTTGRDARRLERTFDWNVQES